MRRSSAEEPLKQVVIEICQRVYREGIKLKTIWITGGSTGIGKNISILLSQHQYDIILISRNKDSLELVKEEIKKINNNCEIIPADLSKKEDFKKIFSKLEEINNIDVLVNNAGVGIFNKIENVSSEEWDIQMDTNLKGAFLITKEIVPGMIKNKSGKINNVCAYCRFKER